MAITTFISEAMIEKRLSELEDDAMGQQWMEDFLQKEPILAGFLFSEDSKILEESEKSLFSYLIIAIWAAVAGAQYETSHCEPEGIEELEEKNWERFMDQKGDFREKLNVFFKNSPQEDLLALIEDMLESESDDQELTKEGKEFIFIKTKTMLDVLMMTAD